LEAKFCDDLEHGANHIVNGDSHVDDGCFDVVDVFLLSDEGGLNGVYGGLLSDGDFVELMNGYVAGVVVDSFGHGVH